MRILRAVAPCRRSTAGPLARRLACGAAAVGVVASIAVPAAGAAAGTTLRPHLITLPDLPAQWNTTPTPTTQEFAAGGACALPFTSPKKDTDAVAAAFAFDRGTAKLSEYLTEGAAAKQRWAKAVKQFRHCQKLKATLGGKTRALAVKPLQFPTIGLTTNAFQLSLRVKGVTLAADIVEFTGRTYVVALTFSSIGKPPLTTVASLARLAVEKLITADYSPPTTTTTTAPGSTSTT